MYSFIDREREGFINATGYSNTPSSASYNVDASGNQQSKPSK